MTESEENNFHRILISGDVNGKIKSLYTRVNKVLKAAGQFDMLFCLGDFFGTDTGELNALLSSAFEVPIPTYVITPINEVAKRYTDENGSELLENLTVLGTQGIYTTVTGLRVVYLSTVSGNDESSSLSTTLLSDALAAEDIGFIGVDLLLTCQWPAHVDRKLTSPLPEFCQPVCSLGSDLVSKLAYFLRPRYHFTSGKGVYYERAPYRNHRVLQEKANHVTRFVALADVKNALNRKYLYALKVVPIDKMSRVDLTQQPSDVTENPYMDLMEKEALKDQETEVQTDQYFYDMNSTTPKRKRLNRESGKSVRSEGDESEHQLKSRKRRSEILKEKLDKPRDQAACWFCLGNPEVKKHLIVSVNTQAYLALPRGPLVTEHVLILTIGHHRSWTTAPDYVRAEIEDYKSRLKRMFAEQGKAMVAFERNLKTYHFQLQIVPVPFSVAAEVKHVFLDLSEHSDSSPCLLKPIPRNTDLSEICSPGVPYFYVELPTGEKLFGQVPKDRISTTDIQFGRTVLCDRRILNCPERADWRNCTDDTEAETQLTAEMREKFAPYDID